VLPEEVFVETPLPGFGCLGLPETTEVGGRLSPVWEGRSRRRRFCALALRTRTPLDVAAGVVDVLSEGVDVDGPVIL
jgi:hypothetical protein